MKTYKIDYVILSNGKAPIIEWLSSLDSTTRKRINQRILRIEDGNFGDHKKISENISELRVGGTIVLLINGGDKSDQSNDIKKAHELLQQWRSNNE